MTVLTNARIVLNADVIHGHIVIENGLIVSVDEGPANGEDMEGDTLLPGLIELHTDHLEYHIAPRPGVRWNLVAALQAHDAQIAASGITTVLDALRIDSESWTDSGINSSVSREMADVIRTAKRERRLRADHYFHLRCEVSEPGTVEGYELFDDCPDVVMISLMDHTPGQRQFASLDAYRVYYQGKHGMSDAEFAAFQAERVARASQWSDANRRALAERARAAGRIVASHDDATLAHVDEAIRDGVTLAEFPTTTDAARASREAGMQVLMGGPNLVRGGSHSGNVSAGALADDGLLDIVSSDYVPFSLLQGLFMLAERPGWSLPHAVATVTANPAEAIGLHDRGSITVGKRADLLRVAQPNGDVVPVARAVWREGRRVA